MAKENVRDSIRLTSVDDLFKTDEARADERWERVMEIPLSQIDDFPDHPFKVRADESMLEMAARLNNSVCLFRHSPGPKRTTDMK